jgi:hypothetical protein
MKRPRSSRFSRKPNAPPAEEPWVWLTRDMMESESWRALTSNARRVLDRIMIEHMSHGGTQNGELIVTYDDFVRFGLSSRRATAQGIRIAVALGFLDVTIRGMRSYGGARRASRYGLTWLPRSDRTPASNRWRSIRSAEDARAVVQAAIDQTALPERPRQRDVNRWPRSAVFFASGWPPEADSFNFD